MPNPATPTSNTHGISGVDGQVQSGIANVKEIGSCTKFIQNSIVHGESYAMTLFVNTYIVASIIADPITAKAAGWIMAIPGRNITSTPTNPNRVPITRHVPNRSRRKTAAKIAVHNGVVNSKANTSAIGIETMPKNHK